MKKHSDVDVLINFASLRSAFDSTMETMQHPQAGHLVRSARYFTAEKLSFFSIWFQIHTIAIIAEGIPEAHTRKIIKTADEKGITVIGPATVSLI